MCLCVRVRVVVVGLCCKQNMWHVPVHAHWACVGLCKGAVYGWVAPQGESAALFGRTHTRGSCMDRFQAYLAVKNVPNAKDGRCPWPPSKTSASDLCTFNAARIAPSLDVLGNTPAAEDADPATFPVAVVDASFMEFNLQVKSITTDKALVGTKCAEDDAANLSGVFEQMTYTLTAVLSFVDTGLGFAPMAMAPERHEPGGPLASVLDAQAWLDTYLFTKPVTAFGNGCRHAVWAPQGLSTLAWLDNPAFDDNYVPELDMESVSVLTMPQPELPQHRYTTPPTFVQFTVTNVPMDRVVTLKLPAHVWTGAGAGADELQAFKKIEITPLYLLQYLGTHGADCKPSKWVSGAWNVIKQEVEQCVAVYHGYLTKLAVDALKASEAQAAAAAMAGNDGDGGGSSVAAAAAVGTTTTKKPAKSSRKGAGNGNRMEELPAMVRREVWAALGICTHGVDGQPMYNHEFGDLLVPTTGPGLVVGSAPLSNFRLIGEPTLLSNLKYQTERSRARCYILCQVVNLLEKLADKHAEQANMDRVRVAQARKRASDAGNVHWAKNIVHGGLSENPTEAFNPENVSFMVHAVGKFQVTDRLDEQKAEEEEIIELLDDNDDDDDDAVVYVLTDSDADAETDTDTEPVAVVRGAGAGAGAGSRKRKGAEKSGAGVGSSSTGLVPGNKHIAELFTPDFASVTLFPFIMDTEPFDTNLFATPASLTFIRNHKMAAWVVHHLFGAMQRTGTVASLLWEHTVLSATEDTATPLAALTALLGTMVNGENYVELSGKAANADRGNFGVIHPTNIFAASFAGGTRGGYAISNVSIVLGPTDALQHLQYAAFWVPETKAHGLFGASQPHISWNQTNKGDDTDVVVRLPVMMAVSRFGLCRVSAATNKMEVVTSRWTGGHGWCRDADGATPIMQEWPVQSPMILIVANPQARRP